MPDSGYPQVNVSAQTDDPTSLLSFYRDLISLRKDNSALRTGSLSIITTGNSGIYASLRANETETILILANLGDKAISDYGLSLGEGVLIPGEYTLSPLLGNGSFTALNVNKNGQFSDFQLLTEVPPYGMYILKIMSK
jgi:glycosidase